MLQCYNRGCGQKYNPDQNTDEACCHHPGEPFFHDAYKGWTCCNKKSVDFTEFLNMKGCTLSTHSNIKPPEPLKSENSDVNVESVEQKIIKSKLAMERPPFSSPMKLIEPNVMPALKRAIDELEPKLCNKDVKEKSNEIEIGTGCKHGGCSATYTNPEADETECEYHPGVPIFHEGMKYWSCCQKKTSDFTAFMNQKGCTIGLHKWVKDGDDESIVTCRYDWHQTASNVTVAIYAKLYHYKKSKIQLNPIRLCVELVFPDQNDAKFNIDLELRGIINVEESTVKMYGTKIEIVMPKAEASNWTNLDYPIITKRISETNTEEKCTEESEKDCNDSDVDLDDIEPIQGARILNLS